MTLIVSSSYAVKFYCSDWSEPHPFLAQVPLTVSPFLSIPTAVTLPYTFRSVPSSLPPSILAEAQSGDKIKYVKSASGHAAHPDDITNACNTLQEHISKTAIEDKKRIENWEQSIRKRDLAEKRRVAPGWLDRDEKILEPMKANKKQDMEDLLGGQPSHVSAPAMAPNREGDELDRVFGKLDVK